MLKTIKNLALLVLIFILSQVNMLLLTITPAPMGPVWFILSTAITLGATLYLAQKMGMVTWNWRIFTKANIKFLLMGTLLMYLGKIIGGMVVATQEQTVANQDVLEGVVANLSPLYTFMALALVAPLTEEVVFRGGIIGLFFKNRPKLGLAISIILFTLAHVPTNLGSVIIYGSMAAVLSFTYYKTRRLELCIALHFINNAIAVGLMALLPFMA